MTTAVQARSAVILDRTRAVNLKPILKKIGALMDQNSRAAFLLQRFGSFVWEPKYPNKKAGLGFISVAGALDEFNRGHTDPSARQFQKRPALMGRGSLLNSITHRTPKRNVLVQGSWLKYAGDHQWGTGNSMVVSDGAKRRIEDWLQTPFGGQYRATMGFLTDPKRKILDTQTVQRPFVGIPPKMETTIRETLEGYFNA